MKIFFRSTIFRVLVLAVSTLPVCSSADVITAAFTIRARYQQTCDIATVPVLDFGTITSNATVAQTSGTMTVNCSYNSQTPFGVWAPLSANASGAQRRMKNNNSSSGNYLNYNLLLGNTGSATIPTASTTTGYTSPINGGEVGVLLRASMPAGQTLTQGYYSDDVILTVSY